MTDTTNRKLRTRRPPAYLVGDNSDPELFGYARTNYTKDFVSPAQELNSIAKLLSKFINSANKRLIEKLNGSQGKQDLSIKNGNIPAEQDTKKMVSGPDGSKSRQPPKTEIKDHNIKQSKDTPSLKDQQQQSNIRRDKNKIPQSNKKDTSAGKSTKYSSQSGGMPNINYMDILQQLSQQKHPGMSLGGLNRSQKDAATRAMEQQQQILNYNPHLREKLQAQHNFHAKNQQGNEKFFRRSTYHVAIAYQIHLNNLKESGKDLQMPMYLDPTYPAKKLKGQFDKH